MRASRIDLGPTTNKNQQRINHKKSFEQPETYETNKSPPTTTKRNKMRRFISLSFIITLTKHKIKKYINKTNILNENIQR